MGLFVWQAFPNACRKFLRKRLPSLSKDDRVHQDKATLEGKDYTVTPGMYNVRCSAFKVVVGQQRCLRP